jgi:hypothetical protein
MLSPLLSPTGRLPRYKRARRALHHEPTLRDRQILDALAAYHFLSAEQACRLVFGSLGSLSYCRDRLKRLYHAHLVDRVPLQRGLYGSPLPVYTPRQRNPVQRDVYFLEHTLATTDFILAANALCQQDSFTLVELVHERDLRKRPVRVALTDRHEAVIPDAYLRVVIDDRYELAWCLELDCGTESSRAFRRKVSRYLAFAAGPYQERFGTPAMTVVVVTTAGPRREASLVAAIEQELFALGCEDQGDLFRVASAHASSESPEALFLGRRFRVPFQSAPVALVPEL